MIFISLKDVKNDSFAVALENLQELMRRTYQDHRAVLTGNMLDEDEMVDLIRGLFSAALKTNPYLEKSVITGILRIAKESLFSGLNNVTVYTLLHSKYSEYFGFTEAEVDDILQHSDLKIQAPGIRAWYNGYLMGETVIYNPWSLANCIQENGLLRPYWVNTSDNLNENLCRAVQSRKRFWPL